MESVKNWSTQSNITDHTPIENLTTVLVPTVKTHVGAELLLIFSKSSVTAKFSFFILILIVGTPGNSFMAYTIWKTPKLRSRTNILLAWLTIADIVTGFTTTLFMAVYQFWIYGLSHNPCDYTRLVGASYTIIKNSIYTSDAIMISIAIDRYVAIVHPLHYQNWITDRWVKITVIICLVFGLSIGCANAIYLLSKVDFTSCATPYSAVMQFVTDNVTYAIVSMVLIVVYGRIFKIAIAQRSKIDVIVASSFSKDSSNEIGSFRKELKAVRTTALIISWYVLLWLPYEVGKFLQGLGNTSSVVQVTCDIGLTMGLANHAFGWIIYGTSSREFREAIVANLKCKKPPFE